MRITIGRRAFLAACGGLLLRAGDLHAQFGKARKVEVDETKTYTITKKNGPWMIMVTSLRGDKRNPDSVANAQKAAHDLVIELRKKGIPAWTFEQQGELEEISSWDRSGKAVKRFVAAQRNRIGVLAGEYASIDLEDSNKTKSQHAKIAKDTLEWIQKYNPKALANGNFKPTPGRPGPLSHAFLTLNPMFSEDEIAQMAFDKDPLLKQLNSDRDFNLLQNPGKYSLLVKTFQGSSKHVLATSDKSEKQATFKFDSMLEKNVSLDKAGLSAWRLTHLLRNQGHEAYVYHERFRSVVTIGSFQDPNDPRMAKVAQQYMPTMKRDPKTGQDVLTPVMFQLEGNNPELFLLDLEPQPFKVPKVK